MIRVRFAPSPTGYLHIGGLRTALYNFLYARQNNGKLILRIEDTDQARLVDGAVQNLISTLEWSGIEFDEGPHKEKGKFGPYTQSKRLSIYQEHTNLLINNGNAYPCFYSKERLNTIKEKDIPSDIITEYDRRYRDLKIDEMFDRMEHENHVIRLKVPLDGLISINDQIRGDIDFDLSLIQDQIIIKSDGYPTYHLASVIDDHLMKISHVIRGVEWIPSLPKHSLLYQSFGWELPKFIHLPLLLNEDKSKLSKRQGDVAVEDYINNGYLKDALLNFVSLLGWHGSNDKEFYSMDELLDNFSIDRVKSSGAVFNIQKLKWFNQHYIKNSSDSQLLNSSKKYLPNDWDVTEAMISLIKDSIETLSDIKSKLSIFFLYSADINQNIINNCFDDTIFTLLNEFIIQIEDKKTIMSDDFKSIINKIKSNYNITSNVWKPIRITLTGNEIGPDLSKTVEILGPSECVNRIKLFVSNHGH